MSKIRRSRDIDTGISYFINIDTGERINEYKYGSGLINTLVSASTKALKPNKTKDLPSAPNTKHKTINRLDKSVKNETVKPLINTENKGEMIVKLLQTHPDNMKFKSSTPTQKKTKDQLNNDILSLDFDKIIDM